ncbi:predicted protein [Thalassiosira pseudonana CCMP1335]|jgi:hypothetical protein|uniref:Uncharacterized protein n=1 Tax=Thalassiosira pseudonana TaxID=35128 RepID=B8BTB0_THAPS|nr:predicted protein [Thalassiosira pseudonana CCMP1335]EED94571.1 predicted protein [Thalassiosira pseudonana CCMP1335]|mmetsp:Transcript_6234/g.13893  ORF Transcript_6234/g.13893 Transcript_6234/m.13893 type:complete len:204 (-) Transcript_6234:3-614(-)|eukprot:scaffold779_cov205-Alexandrium_tamarense.AAC.14
MERVQRYLGIANWKLQGDEYDLETSIYGIEVCPWNGSDYFGVLNVNVKYEDVQLCPLWGKFIDSLIDCPNSHLKSLTLNRIQLTIEFKAKFKLLLALGTTCKDSLNVHYLNGVTVELMPTVLRMIQPSRVIPFKKNCGPRFHGGELGWFSSLDLVDLEEDESQCNRLKNVYEVVRQRVVPLWFAGQRQRSGDAATKKRKLESS